MKLISKEIVLNGLIDWQFTTDDNKEYATIEQMIKSIEETPTVEAVAIPIEWIKKWLSKKVFIWDATTMANEKGRLQAIENIKYGFKTMLEDWEKENDSK